MEKAKEKLRRTEGHLVIGILFWGVLFALCGISIFKEKRQFLNGLVLGIITALFVSISLCQSVQKAANEKGKSIWLNGSFFRMGMVGIVTVIALRYPQIFHVLGFLLGIGTLQLSAYLQPVWFSFLKKRRC